MQKIHKKYLYLTIIFICFFLAHTFNYLHISPIIFTLIVMRLGKKKEKEKDLDPKNQVIDSVLRLICSPKTQHYPLTSKISHLCSFHF